MNYFEDELWDFQEGIELISLTKAKSLKRDLNKMKDFSFFKKTYESYIADLKD